MLGEITFEQAVSQLRNALPNFTNAYNRFVNSYSLVQDDPALVAEWEGLKTKADSFVSAVRWANEKIDAVTDWFSGTVGSWFGLSGLRGLDGANRIAGQLGGQLGIAWVPVAWLVGTVAGLIAVTTAMWAFVRKAELHFQEAQARIALAQQTGNTAVLTEWDRTQGNDGFLPGLPDFSKIVLIVGIGAAAYFLIPKLMKKGSQ